MERKKKSNKLTEIRALWELNPSHLVVGMDLINQVEEKINSLNEKWGRGKLRISAKPELRQKFDRQFEKWHSAIWYGTLESLRDECGRMMKALNAVERNAVESGIKPYEPQVMCVGMQDGRTLAVVPTMNDTWMARLPEGCVVWSLEEIARLIEGQDEITRALKGTFKGAEILKVERRPQFVKDEPEDIA